MEKNYYSNINELIEEVNALGDWKLESEIEKFIKVLFKIARLIPYYSYEHEDPILGTQKVTGNYPKFVIETVAEICKESNKFPSEKDVMQDGKYVSWINVNMRYYPLVKTASGIEFLGESEWMDKAGHEMQKEDIVSMVKSVQAYLTSKKMLGQ